MQNNEEFESLVRETTEYWRGKPNNPLNGMTFREIYEAAREYGVALIGFNKEKKA